MQSRHMLRAQVRAERKLRRTVVNTTVSLLFICIAATLVFGELGYLRYRELQGKRNSLAKEVRLIEEDNRASEQKIERFSQDDFQLEKYMREEYGLSGKGEVTFVFEDEQKPR